MPEEAGANPPVEITRRVFALVAALLCAMAVPAPHANAAAFGEPLWTNRYDGPGTSYDSINAVAVDRNGDVIVTGASTGTNGFYDYATIKYSGAGVPLWTNRYDGPAGGGDVAHAMAVDGSGNVFVTGGSMGTNGRFDYATIKYSGAGVPLWTNRYNGPTNWHDEARAVAVDASGNVFVTGCSIGAVIYPDNDPIYDYDYATIAYSSAGVPLWTNRYTSPLGFYDEARAVAVDASGNVFVTGVSGGTYYDYLTIKYSGAGVPLWTNRYNGPGDYDDFAYAIAVDGSGNVFVTGYSFGNGSSADYATIKYSGAGVPLWTNRYNGPGNNVDAAYAIAVDGSGDVFVTGYSCGGGASYDYATIKYSGAGVPLWINHYNAGNSNNVASAVAVDGSGNVFVTGYSRGNGSGNDYATVAYSGAGVLLWTNRYDGPASGDDRATGLAVDANGNVYVAGQSSGYATIKYAGINSTPPEVKPVAATNGQFQLLLSVDANRAYTVEFRDLLDVGNWLTLTSIAAQPIATNIAVTNAITNGARFYRVRTP
ncbi:MAG TPA: SBBP repeat-containing protein, partial [Verrucomicrobiae bacterium]|jgi:hypothetical protein